MRVVKRYGSPMAFFLALLLITISVLRVYQGHRAQAQQVASNGPPQPAAPASVDADTYSHVQQMRQDLALTNADLAALGCDQAHAQTILSTLVTWYGTNKTALQQAEQAKTIALANLQEINRQIHVGPGLGKPIDQTLIASFPSMQQAAAQAEQQRLQVLAGATAQVSPLLNSTQAGLWATAQANLSAPTNLRYAPGLSSDQIQAITVATYKSGGDANAIQAANASTLNGLQTATLQQAAQNAATYSPNVSLAEQAVLPQPQVLQASVAPTVQPNGTPPSP